jgi:hypothetical protein
MTFSKIVLGFTGVVFAVYGVYCAADPDALAEITGLAFARPDGHTEVRAMYGGLQAGFGLFLIYAVAKPALRVPALQLMLFVFAALAICRLIGISITGADSYNAGAVAYELLTTAFVAAALRGESLFGAPARA